MKKLIFIFLIIITAFFPIGCKGTNQEVETLAVVVAMGFDLTAENQYIATAQILNPQKEPSGMGMQSTQNKGQQQAPTDVLVYSAIGDTPVTAINSISGELGKPLFFGHAKYIVIGKELARSGLSLFVDAALRGYETRPDNLLLITRDKASDVVSAITAVDKIPANAIENLIKVQSLSGYTPAVTRLDFANALLSKTGAPVIGIIDLNKKNDLKGKFKMDETAVFKNDKLIGYLDKSQTRGMQWIKGRVKTGFITVPSLDNGKITFGIVKGSSEIKPILKNNTVAMEITIKEEGNILELQGDLDPMKHPKIMDTLSILQNKAIEKEATLALNAAQKKLKADVFDFGGIIHRTYPEVWNRLKKNWDDFFPNMKVSVKVHSSLKAPGLISKPIE